MVKNLNTIERSERIRIGKNVPDEQAINTVIINASNVSLNAPLSGLYVSPIRYDTSVLSNTLVYNTVTKEIVDAGISADNQTLQDVSDYGNTTTNTLEFNNPTTGFVSISNVGIANTSPIHTLDVGSNLYVSDTDSNVLTVLGSAYIEQNLVVDGNLTVRGDSTLVHSENLTISDPIIELGTNNTSTDFIFDLGIIMNRPGSNVTVGYIEDAEKLVLAYTDSSPSGRYIVPDSSNALSVQVYGNVTANAYFGLGTTLDGVALATDLESNVVRIEILETDMASNTGRIEVLETDMASNTGRIEVLETDLASNTGRIEVLETDLTSNTARIVVLETDLASNTGRIEVLETDLASNTGRIEVLETDLASNTERIEVLETDLASNTGRIEVLETDLASNTGRIEVLETDTASNTARIVVLETDLASNTGRIEVLETDLASNTGRIEVLETDTASNTARIEVLETDMASNASRIGTLEGQIVTKAPINNPVFTGIITGNGGLISNVTLEQVVSYGNTTSNTLYLTNEDTSLVTEGSMGVGTTTPDKKLHVAGDVQVDANVYAVRYFGDGGLLSNTASTPALQLVTQVGSTTDRTVEFTNVTTGFITTSNAVFGGNIYVTEEITVTGNVYAQKDLEVVGNTYVDGNVVTYKDLLVSGNVYVSQNVSVTEELTVSGNVYAQKDLEVVGNTYVSQNVSVTGELSVSGNVYADKDLEVIGNVVTYKDLLVSGNAYVSQNVFVTEELTVSGNVYAQKDLEVVGNVYVDGNVVAYKDFTLTGNAYVTGNVTVTEELTVTGNVYVSTNASVTEELTVSGNVYADKDLEVVGNVYVDGNVVAYKDLLVTGNVYVSTNVDVSRELTVFGNVYADKDLEVIGNTYVDGNVVASKDLTLSGNAYVSGNVNVTKQLSVSGNAYISGNVEVTKALIVSGNTHLEGDNVFVTHTMDFLDPMIAIVTDQVSNVQIRLGQLENVSNLASNPLINQVLTYDQENSVWSNAYPDQTIVQVKNTSGAPMTRGQAVHVTGSTGNNTFQIELADASDPTKMPAIGIVYEDIPINGQGAVVTFGRANGISGISGYTNGDTLYVASGTPGGLTNVKPYGVDLDLIQNVGVVVNNSGGVMFVTGIGRSNDIPNARIITDYNDMQYVYVNSENNDLKKIASPNLNIPLTTAVSSSSNSAANAVTLRGVSITSGDGFHGDLVVAGNVTVDTNTFKVDAEANRVGILTTSPGQTLDVRGSISTDDYLIHNGDTNTKIGFSGDDTFVVNTNGTEQLKIDTNGNTYVTSNLTVDTNTLHIDSISNRVGILTTLPGQALDVRGAANVGTFTTTTGTVTDGTHSTSKDTGVLVLTQGGLGVEANIHSTNVFATSHIAVGTSATSNVLDVRGTANVGALVTTSTHISDSTSATSKTSGALQVTGGVGSSR
jgi:cytoskeletal protein CcmA (bactofilin family)/predicted  nucleic acid-binding Zn-ribbon protein